MYACVYIYIYVYTHTHIHTYYQHYRVLFISQCQLCINTCKSFKYLQQHMRFTQINARYDAVRFRMFIRMFIGARPIINTCNNTCDSHK